MFLTVSTVQGFFAQPAIGGEGGAFYPLDGDKYTDGKQLGHQFAAVGITIAYTALMSALWVSRKCTSRVFAWIV